MTTPVVSVVIPSFNHAPYVTTSVQSALGSTYRDLEVLVVDDGSTDDSVARVGAIRDKRLWLEAFGSNRGAGIATNTALKRARGKYVAILNSDDVALPERFERQVKYLEANPHIGAVFGHPQFINEQGQEVESGQTFYGAKFDVPNRSQGEWIRQFFLAGNCLCHPTVMIRRRCYEEVGMYNPAMAQLPDFDMWVRLVGRYPIHILNEPLTQFRILDGARNASAPRMEVGLRIQFEYLQVLENILKLDERMLHEAFPELGGSTQRNGWSAAIARLLLDRIMGTPGEARNRRPLAWRFAELALTVGQPAYSLFAINTMYRLLPTLDDPHAYANFIKLVGSVDLFGLTRRA